MCKTPNKDICLQMVNKSSAGRGIGPVRKGWMEDVVKSHGLSPEWKKNAVKNLEIFEKKDCISAR